MKSHKRRNFLKTGAGLAIGLGAISINGLGTEPPIKDAGKKIKVLMPDGSLAEVDEKSLSTRTGSMQPAKGPKAKEGIPGRKFVMVIDLGKCNNARKCIEGCQKGHNLDTSQEWMTVHLRKDNHQSEPYWFPKPCYHCDNPPCVKVCPVGATYKRSDGCVLVDVNRCIGCKFCMSACPYSARVFNWEPPPKSSEANQDYSPETSVPGQVGTVGKCDFCPDRSRQGKLPYCVNSCPMGAIYFGDMNEDAISNGTETVSFKELINNRAGHRILEELGTYPSVYYLPPVDKAFSYERGLKNLSEEQKKKALENLSKY
ncbi:MAG: 4Fe-4S dicluster domain-containing protein [Cyclobacteriaceae bacterium]|nr:4Fe-4S dicluster domain-containing protein [Cyclobacteriaceae bacterium]